MLIDVRKIILEENQGLWIGDGLYLGEHIGIIVPLNWPKGRYTCYLADGCIILLKDKSLKKEFEEKYEHLSWDELKFPVLDTLVTSSGYVTLAPDDIEPFDDGDDDIDHVRQNTVSAAPVTKERRFIQETWRRIFSIQAALGNGEYPVLVDNIESPVMVMVYTKHRLQWRESIASLISLHLRLRRHLVKHY
jgi:hypothetical protein